MTTERELIVRLRDALLGALDYKHENILAEADAYLAAHDAQPAPAPVPCDTRAPDGYAYRYHSTSLSGGTVIRFSNGEEINGGRPIEAIPFFYGTPAPQPAPAPAQPSGWGGPGHARLGDPCPVCPKCLVPQPRLVARQIPEQPRLARLHCEKCGTGSYGLHTISPISPVGRMTPYMANIWLDEQLADHDASLPAELHEALVAALAQQPGGGELDAVRIRESARHQADVFQPRRPVPAAHPGAATAALAHQPAPAPVQVDDECPRCSSAGEPSPVSMPGGAMDRCSNVDCANMRWARPRGSAPSSEQPCQTCNGHGMIGGPSYREPDEGGEPCPDCAPPPAPAADGAGEHVATLEHILKHHYDYPGTFSMEREALRAAIAALAQQPGAQEVAPYGWHCIWRGSDDAPDWDQFHEAASDPLPAKWGSASDVPDVIVPLYTAPPTLSPVTDDDVATAIEAWFDDLRDGVPIGNRMRAALEAYRASLAGVPVGGA
jgi:hypothetical protein